MAIEAGQEHEAWRIMRKNITGEDLWPKRKYPLWMDPVTGLPSRSAPAPFNEHAAPRREAKVIRTSESQERSRRARLCIREHLRDRLTEKQYRRVMMLVGLGMSQREIARTEGVDRRAIHDSKNQVIGRTVEAECEDTLIDVVAEALWQKVLEWDQEEARGYALMLRRRIRENWSSGVENRKVSGKLGRDGLLWALWLVCNFFTLRDSDEAWRRGTKGLVEQDRDDRPIPDGENGTAIRHHVSENGEGFQRRSKLKEMADAGVGFQMMETNPGKDSWETDRFAPRSSYDREIDRLTDGFANGSLTRVEYDRDMVLALAEDLRPDSDALEEDWIELKQEVEWACGAFEMGAIQKRERDRRVSLALRAYVSKG